MLVSKCRSLVKLKTVFSKRCICFANCSFPIVTIVHCQQFCDLFFKKNPDGSVCWKYLFQNRLDNKKSADILESQMFANGVACPLVKDIIAHCAPCSIVSHFNTSRWWISSIYQTKFCIEMAYCHTLKMTIDDNGILTYLHGDTRCHQMQIKLNSLIIWASLWNGTI